MCISSCWLSAMENQKSMVRCDTLLFQDISQERTKLLKKEIDENEKKVATVIKEKKEEPGKIALLKHLILYLPRFYYRLFTGLFTYYIPGTTTPLPISVWDKIKACSEFTFASVFCGGLAWGVSTHKIIGILAAIGWPYLAPLNYDPTDPYNMSQRECDDWNNKIIITGLNLNRARQDLSDFLKNKRIYEVGATMFKMSKEKKLIDLEFDFTTERDHE